MRHLSIVLLLLSGLTVTAQYTPKEKGTVMVRGEKIKGLVSINMENNSVMVDQGDMNRMFIEGIELIELDISEEVYISANIDGQNALFNVIIDGEVPLLERLGFYFSYDNGELIHLDESDEKVFYSVFGKDRKNIKDYAFVRNIPIQDPQGIISLFQHYNQTFAN